MRNPLSYFLLVAFCLTAHGQAAVLGNYNFNAATGASTDADAGSTAGNFTITNGGAAGGGAGISASTFMAFFRSDGLTATEADAISAPDYFTFTLTPTGQYALTSLVFDFGGSGGGTTDGSGAFTSFTSVRSNLDNYAANLGTASKAITESSGNQLSSFSIDLTGTTISAPMTFRFYLYQNNAGTSAEIVRMDNVVLNGGAVPEPSAFLLGSIGAIGLLNRRRRPVR